MPKRLLSVLLFAAAAFAPAPATAVLNPGLQDLFDAVVRIDVREMAFEEGARRYRSSIGSGVIVDAGGLILTNAHVVGPRTVEIRITLANLERVGATLVGWDHWTDLALLRLNLDEIRSRGLSFRHAAFGESSELSPGQTVYAVGTPHGLTRTVTRGIISNTNRYFEDSRGVRGYETGAFNTWLQTDAAINPGNSGGPLVTEDGRVVGINSRGYLGADNLGFAIPSSIARKVMEDLRDDGEIVRSYIGIVPGALQDLEGFYRLNLNEGMLINSVDPGSPAARAGLRPGDILLQINGRTVDGRFPEQLPPIQDRIASLPVGSEIELKVRRGSDDRVHSVTTERLYSRVGEEWVFERWGLSVRKVSRSYARENQLPDTSGVIVIGVQSGYPGQQAGLERRDILTKVDDDVLTDLETLKEIYKAYETEPKPLLLEVRRNRRVSLLILKP